MGRNQTWAMHATSFSIQEASWCFVFTNKSFCTAALNNVFFPVLFNFISLNFNFWNYLSWFLCICWIAWVVTNMWWKFHDNRWISYLQLPQVFHSSCCQRATEQQQREDVWVEKERSSQTFQCVQRQQTKGFFTQIETGIEIPAGRKIWRRQEGERCDRSIFTGEESWTSLHLVLLVLEFFSRR